jgi:hypothetical protein
VKKYNNMSRLIISEEEKKQILSLYVEQLTPEELDSPKGIEAKLWKEFFNYYYRLNLPLDSDWSNPEFNEAMKRYIDEKGFEAKPDSRGLYFAEVPLGWTVQKNKDLKCAKQALYSVTNDKKYPMYSITYKDGKYFDSKTKQEITEPEALTQIKSLEFKIHPNCKK